MFEVGDLVEFLSHDISTLPQYNLGIIRDMEETNIGTTICEVEWLDVDGFTPSHVHTERIRLVHRRP